MRLISILFLFSGVGAEVARCTNSDAAVVDENSLLQDKNYHWWNRATTEGAEVDYIVTRDYVQTDAPGLAFRASMDLEDRDPSDSLSMWGSKVRGEPIGMDWLKVGARYLPMRVGGHPVLERETRSNAATLAVTGQEPDATESEDVPDGSHDPDGPATEVAEEAEASEAEAEAAAEPEAEAAAEPEADDPEAEEEIEEEIEDAATELEPVVSQEAAAEIETAEEAAIEGLEARGVTPEAAQEAVAAAEAEEEAATESAAEEEEEEEVTEVATEPEAADEAVTEPEVAEEVAAEPQVTEEAVAEPQAAEEVATEPVAAEEVATEPAAIVTEEVATEPFGAAEPAAVEEVATEPAAIEPEVTDAVGTELEAAEPEFVEPEPEPFDGVVVEFGVIFRSLPMLDFQTGTFTTSLAFTQRWPTDAASFDAAAVGDDEDPWSPNLVVTNHDIGGVEAISTSRSVNQTSGMITQVDYLTVRVLQTFELKSFPFDSQVLSVRVAPASPGDVSMKLVPIDVLGEPTLDPNLLEGHGFRLEAVNEVESILQAEEATLADPARGVVEVAMSRRASAYFSQLFLPSFLVICVCWSTFFLPVPDAAFATPRTAVTAMAFVAMLVLLLHIEQMVPARFGRMWIDVFTENIMTLVFAAIAFNTLEQYVHGTMKKPALASSLSRELQMLYPALSVFLLGMCFCVTRGEHLTTLSAFCRLTSLTGICGFSGAAYARAMLGDEEKPRGAMVIRSPR